MRRPHQPLWIALAATAAVFLTAGPISLMAWAQGPTPNDKRHARPHSSPSLDTPTATPSPSSSSAAPTPTPATSPSSAAPTGAAPFAFGTLVTRLEHATEESSRGVTVAMMELSWANYEPAAGQFNAAYAQQMRARLATLRAAGMRVTLGLGIHFTPGWIFEYPDSRYVNQRGQVANELNVVFNQAIRSRVDGYLRQVNRDLGFGNFWAVRLTSGGDPEVLYPGGGSYWAFDANAQNGAQLPPSMARNPLPGWKPGQQSVSLTQVRAWADWYVHGLDDVVAWQMRLISSLGFGGYYQLLTPGSGTRPDGYARAIANYLPDGVTGVGAVWQTFYASLPDKHGVVAYVSSMADGSGGDDSCTSGDAAIPVSDSRADGWSAARWIARLAHEYGLPASGENPGWNMPSSLNTKYVDGSSSGMMAVSVRQMTSCRFQGMYWAHDENLWNGRIPFDRYADWVATTNGGA